MEFETLLLVNDPFPRDAGVQMAIDQILLTETTLPILRVYRWEKPCVTMGYFEHFENARCDYPGFEITRRWTGGGSVQHGSDWPYSLIIPKACSFTTIRPLESYARLHAALARVLATTKSGIALASTDSPKLSSACFDNPVQFDILRDGQKIAGAGQRRSKLGLLHQGSLQLPPLLHPEAQVFAKALAQSVSPLETSSETLRLAEQVAQERYNNPAWLLSR
jgi:lipoate-protein ligase A